MIHTQHTGFSWMLNVYIVCTWIILYVPSDTLLHGCGCHHSSGSHSTKGKPHSFYGVRIRFKQNLNSWVNNSNVILSSVGLFVATEILILQKTMTKNMHLYINQGFQKNSLLREDCALKLFTQIDNEYSFSVWALTWKRKQIFYTIKTNSTCCVNGSFTEIKTSSGLTAVFL